MKKYYTTKRLCFLFLSVIIAFQASAQTSQPYNMQIGNATITKASANSGCFSGTFNNSGTEIGMYANGSCSGIPAAVHFQTFTTNGVGSGTARPLQIGDEFTITGYIGSSNPIFGGGAVGISFNDNTSYVSVSDYNNTQRAKFEIVNNGNWYSSPATSTFPSPGSDATFKIKVTSSNTVNLTLNGTTYYDLVMLNTPSSTSKIQSFALYTNGGGGSNNNYWKNGNLSASTTVEIGAGNGTSTISGVITDGLTATSTSTTSVNAVAKSGTGTITLSGANSYTGATTITGGTLKAGVSQSGSTGAFGNNSAVTISLGCTLDLNSNNATVYSVSETGTNNGGLITLGSGTLTVSGGWSGTKYQNSIGGTSGSIVKKGTGTLSLYGTQSYTGSTTVSGGELATAVVMASTNYTVNGGTFRAAALNILPSTCAVILSSGTFAVDNSQTINNLTMSGGTLSVAAGQTLTINGTFTYTSGTVSLGSGAAIAYGTNGTLVYNTGGSYSATASEWPSTNGPKNITIQASGTKITLPGSRTINGALSFTNGNTGNVVIGNNTLTLNGTVSNMSANNSFTGSSTSNLTITATSNPFGTIYFDATISADVSTTTGTNALQNLVINGSGGSVTLGNKLNLFNRLSVSAGTLNTGDNLVLRSTSSNTAYVDQVAGTINGQVIVERYIHKQTRGWRALTAPVTYNGISQGYISGNWQSDFGYSANYGTRITGASGGTGLDNTTTGNSLQTYNSTTGAWTKVTNTTTETQSGSSGSADNKGFFIFIRGDRTVTPNGSTPNAFVSTTLAAKGLLQTGTQTFTFGGTANKSWLIGNPYACPVDMSTVSYNNTGQYVYVWDPNLTGNTTTGNYATFDRNTWGNPTAGTSTKYFQSGQAFFVKPTSTTASIVFTETNKSTSANNNTQITGAMNTVSDIFNVKLLNLKADGTTSEVDGIRAKYGASFSADVDEDDAAKLVSSTENISLSRNGSLLTIEARPYIITTDTLFLNLTSMGVGANYRFYVNPVNFDASISSCKLVDNFLNSETSISLTSPTTIDFNVTSVSGSNAANRFYVVFNAAGSLPISNALTLNAYKKDKAVVVDWKSIAENNMKLYEVEKSLDGNNFIKLSSELAKNGNTNNTYSAVDNTPSTGLNYYRIKSIQSSGNIVYSIIVRVEMTNKSAAGIAVYPNPVKGKTIGLQLTNLAAGTYAIKLYNAAGQEVWANSITHNGSNGSISLQLSKVLVNGVYQLQLTDTKGNNFSQSVLVEQ